ncbi:MAG: ABC transporter substrate-binding protein, partial [Chloroflexi bacterium]|nr:ABC transporter substrate-binding protein [Chloroflexota bacterium]
MISGRLMLATGLLASVAAVGPAGVAAQDLQKLVVYSAEPGSVAGYEAAIVPFETANDVDVEFISYESADFLTQFPNAVRSNSQIDVILANGQDVRTLVSKDLLAPLGDAIDPTAMIPPALEPFNIGGEQYAVGVNTMYTTGVAVNQALMEQYDLAAPTTFADLEANVAKLEGTGVSLFSVPGSNIYLWPIWYMQ